MQTEIKELSSFTEIKRVGFELLHDGRIKVSLDAKNNTENRRLAVEIMKSKNKEGKSLEDNEYETMLDVEIKNIVLSLYMSKTDLK